MGIIKEVHKFTKRGLRTEGWYQAFIPDRHRPKFKRGQIANFVLAREGLAKGDTASFLVITWLFAYKIDKDRNITYDPIITYPNDSEIDINAL